MTERTPGPWCFEAENGRAHPRVYGADNSLIAEVGNANLMRWEVWDHDARLIAAAPELMEALRSCEAWIDRWTSHVGNCKGGNECSCGRSAISHEARAAIAKATEPRP